MSILEIKPGANEEFKINPVMNLYLNMSGGVLPEHLSKAEVELLEKEVGKDWFEKMGYSEPEYRKPIF